MEENFGNINHIKSYYIMKKTFDLLSKNIYLDMIKYNKALQTKMQIQLDDYKKEGNKYKIGEKNGYGKEYKLNTNILLFKGE